MPRREKVDQSAALEQRHRLFQRYHFLIDQRLKGKLSLKHTEELQRIEETLQTIEDVETAEMMHALEHRHAIMMQKLNLLTSELRKMAARTGVAGPAATV
jgi:hypothetical protein